jgi:hypothetical protein
MCLILILRMIYPMLSLHFIHSFFTSSSFDQPPLLRGKLKDEDGA